VSFEAQYCRERPSKHSVELLALIIYNSKIVSIIYGIKSLTREFGSASYSRKEAVSSTVASLLPLRKPAISPKEVNHCYGQSKHERESNWICILML